MKILSLALLMVAVTICQQCGQGQAEGQYDTNMKVNVQLSSLQQMLNRGCQSLLNKHVKAAMETYPLVDFALKETNYTDITVSTVDSLEKITVARDMELHEEDLIQVSVPELYLGLSMKVNGVAQKAATRANVTASFKAVSSQEASWKAQLFFRQLKVQFYNSTIDGADASDYSDELAYLQSAVGQRIGKYLSANQNSLNEKLAELEQHFFMGAYDLGLSYNYTLQPNFTEDDDEYSFNLHGSVHHSYNYMQGDHIQRHRISSMANPASFLSIPANNQNITMRYLLSDRLLSSMFGAQYETATALDQKMSNKVINKFIKWLEVGMDLNMLVVDKLFNGVTKRSGVERESVLGEKVGVALSAADYPYFDLSSDNTVVVKAPMQLVFQSKEGQDIARVVADMKMSLQLKHDPSRHTLLNVHGLSVEVEHVSEFENKMQPQEYSRSDLEMVRRVVNGALYFWAHGIQKTINLKGLEVSQFLPDLSFEQLSTQNQNMVKKQQRLLTLVKGKQTMETNAFVNTFLDLKKIKASVSEILSGLQKYMFSE